MSLSFYIKTDQEFLHARLWIPAKCRDEAVVFCHGWGGGTPYDDLLSNLAERGYYTLRFSHRGYGESTGQADLSLWVNDLGVCASVLSDVAKRVWVAGQSTGGAMALIAATVGDRFVGAVSIAPFCTLDRIIKDNSQARGILEARFGPLQEKHFKAADALSFVRRLQKPVLLVHGTEDESVPFEHGHLLYKQLQKGAHFISVPGGNHHLTNVDRSPVLDEIVSWLEAHGSS